MATPKQRQLLTIGTINARTIATTPRQLELDHAMEKIERDIPGVTEARVKDQESYILPSDTVLFHSITHHGVAFLVRQVLANDVRFTPLSNQLATLHHPSLKVYLVLCYAPALSNDNYDEYDNYFEEVVRICRRIKKGHIPILLGDMNATLGREPGNETIIGKYTYGHRMIADVRS
ncbi:hypothetical protein Y032_0001g399 [Ancylostoma ceylanicum]|uniref:Endonuclease/exonuclease/phosphatase domain-containing protein n=1 Tax=Ancylostoma ceylanicum TaxID=53326 RepID=A0A016W535_9BILA|nr:hypothetical protein Y032_0001g399 [Ancylostoma ceylanicum]